MPAGRNQQSDYLPDQSAVIRSGREANGRWSLVVGACTLGGTLHRVRFALFRSILTLSEQPYDETSSALVGLLVARRVELQRSTPGSAVPVPSLARRLQVGRRGVVAVGRVWSVDAGWRRCGRESAVPVAIRAAMRMLRRVLMGGRARISAAVGQQDLEGGSGNAGRASF